jgi:type IV secretory pathway VirB10-like protein
MRDPAQEYTPDPPPRVGWPRTKVMGLLALILVAGVGWIMSTDWWALVWPGSKTEDAPIRQPARQAPPVALPSYTPLPMPLAAVAEVPRQEPAPAVDEDAKLRVLQEQISRLQQQLEAKPAPVVTPMPTVPKETAEQRKQRRQQEAEARKRREQEQKAWKSGGGSLKRSDAEMKGALQALKTPWSLPPATKINCRTKTQISNEAPGVFLAEVTRAVKTLDGVVVIPQGTEILGKPSGQSIYGDSRIPATLTTITFPNRTYMEFPQATMADQAGTAGIAGDVDRHYGRLLMSIMLTGLLRGGTTLVAGGMGYGVGGQDPAQAIGGAVASDAARQGEQTVRQSINTSPTITVPRSYGCLIILERELVLPGPYREL